MTSVLQKMKFSLNVDSYHTFQYQTCYKGLATKNPIY